MTRFRLIGFIAAAGLVVLIGFGTVISGNNKPRPITLTFTAEMDGKPLVFDEFLYANPGGEGLFRLRDFRVYISNIVLSDGEDTHRVQDSYHLLRFDRNTPEFSVTLPDVPLRRISDVAMSIGIDEAANGSIESRGDLDPNNRMAWNWQIGYKFILAEGAIRDGDAVQPLVYHVGFNENRRDLSFSPPQPVTLSEMDELTFSVDVMNIFDGATVIDMTALQTVKMDKTDASQLAENYTTMIEALWEGGN